MSNIPHGYEVHIVHPVGGRENNSVLTTNTQEVVSSIFSGTEIPHIHEIRILKDDIIRTRFYQDPPTKDGIPTSIEKIVTFVEIALSPDTSTT